MFLNRCQVERRLVNRRRRRRWSHDLFSFLVEGAYVGLHKFFHYRWWFFHGVIRSHELGELYHFYFNRWRRFYRRRRWWFLLFLFLKQIKVNIHDLFSSYNFFVTTHHCNNLRDTNRCPEE
ncbi:MAG: hypothetical protein IPI91_01100 [Flavobacteriales bacterium]|nr:hypothetical protein [Flavobacteriales bacterium]